MGPLAILGYMLVFIGTSYLIYNSSTFHYYIKNKEDLVLKVRTQCNATYFLGIFILFFSFAVLYAFIIGAINLATLLLPICLMPEFIILYFSNGYLYIFKDRILLGNDSRLFSKLDGLELKERRNPKKCELLIKGNNSTYVETIFSRDKEVLINTFKPLLGENSEFKC